MCVNVLLARVFVTTYTKLIMIKFGLEIVIPWIGLFTYLLSLFLVFIVFHTRAGETAGHSKYEMSQKLVI